MSEHDPPRMRELELRDSELSELLEAGVRDVAPPEVLARSAARLGPALGIDLGPFGPTTPPLDATADAIGQSAATAPAGTAAATHAAASSMAVAPVLGGAAKAVLALALASATGIAVWTAGHAPVDAPRAAPAVAPQSARITAPAPAHVAVPAVPATHAEIQPRRSTQSIAPATAPEAVRDMPAITSRASRLRPRAHGDTAPSSASTPPPSTTAEQLRNLQTAQAELATRPQDAVLRLRAHAHRYPQGWLEEERAALLVEALLRAGDVAEATRALAALRADHPRSPALPRLQHKLDATR